MTNEIAPAAISTHASICIACPTFCKGDEQPVATTTFSASTP